MSTDALIPQTLPAWLSSQRWYASKGSTPRVERIGGWAVTVDGVRVSTHYLLDRAERHVVLYQVPVTERVDPLPDLVPIGVLEGRYVYDATADPVYAATLLDMMLTERVMKGSTVASADGATDEARGHRQPGASRVVVTSSAVLKGEQSNTSIICQVLDGAPVIIKIFRALHNGENPDVTLQSAIAAAGSTLVPTSLGSVSGSWSDPAMPDGRAVGHLAFAQEFLPGVEDAWRVALRAAEAGEDFSVAARALGEATADVHAVLAVVMPTRVPTAEDIAQVLASMRSRLDLATSEIPTLEPSRAAIEAMFAAAESEPWPLLQRIHGDYHLGQVLAVPGRGWVLLDFEGEPLRPMAERSRLDVTFRDVAGMLRSFDYAAGTVALRGGGDMARAWAAAARDAFLEGYVARSGTDVRSEHALLDAFEIDKALYEAVYEARNRPAWLEIPVTAIRRLAGGSSAGCR